MKPHTKLCYLMTTNMLFTVDIHLLIYPDLIDQQGDLPTHTVM